MDYLWKLEANGVYIIIDNMDTSMPEVLKVFRKKEAADKYIEWLYECGAHEDRTLSIHFNMIDDD